MRVCLHEEEVKAIFCVFGQREMTDNVNDVIFAFVFAQCERVSCGHITTPTFRGYLYVRDVRVTFQEYNMALKYQNTKLWYFYCTCMDGILFLQDFKFYWLQMFPAGYNWGWILGAGPETMPYVCKISKEDIFKIQEHERGPGKKYYLNLMHGLMALQIEMDWSRLAYCIGSVFMYRTITL